MRLTKIITLLIFLILTFVQFVSYAQQHDSVSEDVKSYWKLMDQFSSRYKNKNDISKKFSDEEIDTLTISYYRVISEDPIGMMNEFEHKFQKWDSVTNAIHGLPKDDPPGVKLRKTRDIIASKFGKNFANIISVPFYLKVKIIEDSSSVYEGLIDSKRGYIARNIFKTRQSNITAIVEEIIKGNKFFKEGQKITIGYLPFWTAGSSKHFENGKTYFVPLKLWDSRYSHSQFTINILPDNNYAIYPIERNTISTPNNYFRFGNSTNWNEFKKEFMQKYILN